MARDFAPIHPGEVLKLDFMDEYGLSARALARRISVPPNRITELVNGERSVTPDTAIRLERLFGMSAQAWLNMQHLYDLEVAQENAEGDETIQNIESMVA